MAAGLKLSRRVGEKINMRIDGELRCSIVVETIKGKSGVLLRIDAPPAVEIIRAEIDEDDPDFGRDYA